MLIIEITIDIACTVTCCQNDRTMQLYFSLVDMIHCADTHDMLILDDELCHLRIEVHLSARLQNLFAHVLNDTW